MSKEFDFGNKLYKSVDIQIIMYKFHTLLFILPAISN